MSTAMNRQQELHHRRAQKLIALYTQEPRLTLDQIGEAMGYKDGPRRVQITAQALNRLRKKGYDIPRRLTF